MILKYLGLLSVCVLFLGLWFITKRWSYDKHHTFSQHVARYKSAIFFYMLLFVIVLIPLNIFFIKWFVPTYHISHWFIAVIIFSSITQIGCTLIPEVGNIKTKIHQALAGLSAISLIPALVILNLAHIASIDKIITIISLLLMATVIAIVIRQKDLHKHLLLLQVFYFGALFLPVLVVSYL